MVQLWCSWGIIQWIRNTFWLKLHPYMGYIGCSIIIWMGWTLRGSALNHLIERSSRSTLMIIKYWQFIFISPSEQGYGAPFFASYCCTLRVQFGNRYASTVWLYWNIINVIDNFFPLFPYLLLYRTEEAAGSNPARSTILFATKGENPWLL